MKRAAVILALALLALIWLELGGASRLDSAWRAITSNTGKKEEPAPWRPGGVWESNEPSR